MRKALVLTILLCCVACSSDGDNAPSADMTLEASVVTIQTDTDVDFSITASTSETMITSSRIDFDEDGTWDETHTHSEQTITTTFHHSFTTEGVKHVRAQVLAGNEVLATKTTALIVDNRKTVVMAAWATSLSLFAPCLADGPPYAVGGTASLYFTKDTRRSVGRFAVGSPVSFTQAFRQQSTYVDPILGGTTSYACHFFVRVYTGSPEVELASGECTTSSGTTLTCSVPIDATMP
jgi:hypothetical protein